MIKRISIPTPGFYSNQWSEVNLTEVKRIERRLDYGVAAGEGIIICWGWREMLLPVMVIPVFAFGKPSVVKVVVFYAA